MNVPHWIQRPKDPKFNEGEIKSYKFVDDSINTSVVNMCKANLLVEEGHFFKEVVDLRTQGLLQHISTKAKDRGMQINAAKTSLVCISAATSFEARIRLTLDNQTVQGQDNIKIQGVTLDKDCSFKTHVETLQKCIRART